ncbi:MAG: methylated-DNA--[protein]-cysteine S-methyltransferase [bacterium]
MTSMISIQYAQTPIGELIIGVYQNQLCLLDFRYRKMRLAVDRRLQIQLKTSFVEQKTDLMDQVKTQLSEYLNGERKDFDLPLLLVGSQFQKRVWGALLKVQYGTTASYLELAKSINNEKAVRAVASANGANAIGIIVPCHRIIGSDGKLVGYGGGTQVKKKLLELESGHARFYGEKLQHRQQELEF